MHSDPDDKRIDAARDYFKLADQGRPDVLELFHEDAEIYFPKFGFGFGRQSFLEMTNGFAGTLEFIRHDYDALTFIPAGDLSWWRVPPTARSQEKRGLAESLAAVGSAMSSNSVAIVFRVSTSILIPTTPVRTSRGFDGVWIANGEVYGSARRPVAQLFRMARSW